MGDIEDQIAAAENDIREKWPWFNPDAALVSAPNPMFGDEIVIPAGALDDVSPWTAIVSAHLHAAWEARAGSWRIDGREAESEPEHDDSPRARMARALESRRANGAARSAQLGLDRTRRHR